MSFLEKLARVLQKSEIEVEYFLQYAPKKYRVYKIPKRTSGFRTIAQPTKELKEYQRAFLNIQSFPVHNTAKAYRTNVSIKDNANVHKANKYFLKMDFDNFFNSITSELFWRVCLTKFEGLTIKDKELLDKLLFWSPGKTNRRGLVLSVGAPSSPLISNFFMFEFDEVISKYCIDNNISFTRYADDLTFSTNKKDILFSVPGVVKECLDACFNKEITINKRKTVFSSKAHNRHVTGITINNSGALSLGRERKRYIKHLVHQYTLNMLDKEKLNHLKGLLAFSMHIEPNFIKSLNEKYTLDLMNSLSGDKYDKTK
ncbi:MAG: RNA-directed DNA polymerase [Oceanicoccus sp.]|jgi:RNA-directed DNA polymerase